MRLADLAGSVLFTLSTEAFYANRVAQHTTLDISADEVHRIGRSEVERIHDEMREIMAEVEFEGELPAFNVNQMLLKAGMPG